MISTFFGQDALSSPAAMLAALVIGLAFGFSLEQAGFGSSRRLAGIFYFRDMTVLKVMFTAVIVAMLGLLVRPAAGPDRRGAAVLHAQHLRGPDRGRSDLRRGLCHGRLVPRHRGGRSWPPAVWMPWCFWRARRSGASSSTKCSACLKGLYTWGDRGVQFAWQALGLSAAGFAILFVLVAVGCFWGAEYLEKRVAGTGALLAEPVPEVLQRGAGRSGPRSAGDAGDCSERRGRGDPRKNRSHAGGDRSGQETTWSRRSWPTGS